MKIALGVSGGIAAYKAAEIVRQLQERAVRVQVIMTAAAQEFVRPLTFAALSGEKVITSMFGSSAEQPNLDSAVEHISVAQSIEALLVAPATADVIAKFAQGIANDFLATLYLATKAPVIIAPAMNVNMWEHPATQANLQVLRDRGVRIVEPGSGYLACGMIGAGRMAEPEEIVAATLERLGVAQDLAGETVLITAGPTLEPIDPVRYLGQSLQRQDGLRACRSGAAARSEGHSGERTNGAAAAGRCRNRVRRDGAADALGSARSLGAGRASSSWPPRWPTTTSTNASPQKIKRNGAMQLQLEPNPDILADLGSLRQASGKREPMLIGFAAETENVLENARAQARKKGRRCGDASTTCRAERLASTPSATK